MFKDDDVITDGELDSDNEDVDTELSDWLNQLNVSPGKVFSTYSVLNLYCTENVLDLCLIFIVYVLSVHSKYTASTKRS